MLRWNKALWLVYNSHGTWNSQSESFISAKRSQATLKFVYDISCRIQFEWNKIEVANIA